MMDSRAWEFLKNMDRRYQQRVNYILVAESMLLFSFVSTYSSINIDLETIRIAISFTGIAITLGWIVVNIRLCIQMRAIQKEYIFDDSVHKHLIDSVQKNPNAILILTYIIPGLICFLWVFLTHFTIFSNSIDFFPIPFLLFLSLIFIFEYGIKIWLEMNIA